MNGQPWAARLIDTNRRAHPAAPALQRDDLIQVLPMPHLSNAAVQSSAIQVRVSPTPGISITIGGDGDWKRARKRMKVHTFGDNYRLQQMLRR